MIGGGEVRKIKKGEKNHGMGSSVMSGRSSILGRGKMVEFASRANRFNPQHLPTRSQVLKPFYF